jgi:hypothetical protein
VLGDVGVRFGGSEHHRIGTSSSHTRPPPFGVGIPGQRDRAAGALRRTGKPVSRERQAARFGALATLPPGQSHPTSSEDERLRSTGSGKRRSSEHRAPNLTGTGQPELFGAPASQFHWDREPAALRGRRHPTPRDREPPALRSRRHPTPPGHSKRHSSEGRARRLTGQGNHTSSEERQPGSTGTGKPHLFGGAATRFHRPGISRPRSGQGPNPNGDRNAAPLGAPTTAPRGARNSRSSEHGDLAPQGMASGVLRRAGYPPREWQAVRFGAQATLPRDRATGALRGTGKPVSRDRATGALRGTGKPVPPGQGTSGSSGPTAPHPTGQGTTGSSEPTAPHPTGARQTALFGGSGAAPHRDQVTEPLRRSGTPVPPGLGIRPASPGSSKRGSSEPRAPVLTGMAPAHGVRQTALFGGSGAAPHRGTANGALRRTGRRASSEQGTSSSSEPGRPSSTGQGTRDPSGSRAPQLVG